ncbi:putative F-box domain-containing protein [Helianthus annuus]|nr:putative F-box domain-containing protein [Helianthus annuus]
MSDYIPFALQSEIMKRLPTRSLMQFRSVSKQWKSLIDSSQFIVDYSRNHTHQQHLLVCYTSQEAFQEENYVSIVDDETFPEHKCFLPPPTVQLGEPTILGSSQGLFFVYTLHVDPHNFRRIMCTAAFWNPSIRKSVAVDVPYVLERGSNPAIGFGVCPHTRDPMIVKINFSHSLSNLGTITFTPWQVEVYTLSSRAWRSIPTINQPRNSIQLARGQIVIDEFIYWLAIDGLPTEFQGFNLILSFNMTSEEFKEVSLPDTLARAPTSNVVISKLKESLLVVEIAKEAEKQVYGVWMMEHGVSNLFTKLFTINSPDASIQVVLGFRKNNEPVFAMSADYNVRDVFVHEVHSEHINHTQICANGFPHSACSYMETLLLLDH